MAFTPTLLTLLCVSTGILLFAWIFSLRQLCCITRIDRTTKLNNTFFVVFFFTIAMILNTLIYLLTKDNIYNLQVLPHIKLHIIVYLFEAILEIISFHKARTILFGIVEQLYIMIDDVSRPKIFKFILYLAQIIITITCIIFYIMGLFIYDNIIYIYCFYVIMSIVIFLVSLSFIFILKVLLKVLSEVMINDQNYHKIESSKRAVKGTLTVLIFICIGCIIHIFTDTETMYDYMEINWDNTLANCILHSLFFIMIGFAFMLLVFDINKKKMCKIHKYSIVGMYCCNCCGGKSKKKKKKKKKVKKKKNNLPIFGEKNSTISIDTESTEPFGAFKEPLNRKPSITGAIN